MLVFIDESGDHNLNYTNVSDAYNIFVLSGICIKEKDYEIFDNDFKSLKKELFGTDEFIVHTVEITRPNKSKDKINLNFNDPVYRKIFYTKINELIYSTNFEICACIIKKTELRNMLYMNSIDPYIYSFNNLLDKILAKCDLDRCKIYPEVRSFKQDLEIQLEYVRAQNLGTLRFSKNDFLARVKDFDLVNKKANLSGSQLCDLVVTPIGRNFIGKLPKPFNEVDFDVIKDKITDLTIYP